VVKLRGLTTFKLLTTFNYLITTWFLTGLFFVCKIRSIAKKTVAQYCGERKEKLECSVQ